jgi:2-isopropylmalate synthase
VERLAREIVDAKLHIRAACAARTMVEDIQPIVDISQRVGMPIEVHAFIGSSPIRRYVEEWDLDRMLEVTREATRFSVSHGCPVMYVTEDTTRSDPETVRTLLSEAVACGATRVCICDTVGHSTPHGVRALVRFVREQVLGGQNDVRIDWHGHADRGLALINALVAIEAGADRVHGTGLGIGERAGNVPMDLLLVNMKLCGFVRHDLTKLKEYCDAVAHHCGCVIPPSYPVVGRDAFRTGTGVHAAAIIKSIAKEEDSWLCDEIYSGVRAGDFGYHQVIEIGPLSGKSNVEYWLRQQGLDPHPVLVDMIFEHAKEASSILTDDQVYRVIVERFLCRQLAERPGGKG